MRDEAQGDGQGSMDTLSPVKPTIFVFDCAGASGRLVLDRHPGEGDAAHAERTALYAGLFSREDDGSGDLTHQM
jgi:hypothetical protein